MIGITMPTKEVLVKQKQQLFLVKYEATKVSIAAAAKMVGLTYQQIHAWMRGDSKFKEEVEVVKDMITDEIEAGIIERALKLEDKKDATLAIYYHKGRKPQFRDNAKQVVVSGEMTLKDQLKKG